MEIQDDRWGCWISLKELARLRLADELLSRLTMIEGIVIDWDRLSEQQIDQLDDLIEQIQNMREGK